MSLVAKDSIYAILYKALDFIKPLMVFPLLINYFGGVYFGQFSRILIYVTFLAALLDGGFNVSYQRWIHKKTPKDLIINNLTFHLCWVLFWAGLLLISNILFETTYRVFIGEFADKNMAIQALFYSALIGLNLSLMKLKP